jgi:hypothetical protein
MKKTAATTSTDAAERARIEKQEIEELLAEASAFAFHRFPTVHEIGVIAWMTQEVGLLILDLRHELLLLRHRRHVARWSRAMAEAAREMTWKSKL